MPVVPIVGVVFVGLAVIFIGVTLQSYLHTEGKLTPARQAWLRIALIFAAVGAGLSLLQTLLW